MMPPAYCYHSVVLEESWASVYRIRHKHQLCKERPDVLCEFVQSLLCCLVVVWYQLFIQVFKFKVVSFFGKKKKRIGRS